MRVLIASIALVTTGCYAPGVTDCQFSCGSGQACPDGTSCEGGFCRTSSRLGACGAAIDGALDADETTCPAAPQPMCGARFRLVDGTCAVVCTKVEKFPDAVNMCGTGAWAPGKVDTLAKLDALQPTASLWIGASGGGVWTWSDGTPVDPVLWTGGVAPTGGAMCAHLTVQRRLSNEVGCDMKLARLCTAR
jgi:hypothetical protein